VLPRLRGFAIANLRKFTEAGDRDAILASSPLEQFEWRSNEILREWGQRDLNPHDFISQRIFILLQLSLLPASRL